MPDPKDGDSRSRIAINFDLHHFTVWADRMFDIEQHSYIIGLNSAIGGAISSVCYQSLSNVISRTALPIFCGVSASKLWQTYISGPLRGGELGCPVCVTTRGMVIAFATATLFPAMLGGLLSSRGKMVYGFKSGLFLKDLAKPYKDSVSKRPLLSATIIIQVALGFIMADREYEHIMRKIITTNELTKGRKIIKVESEGEITAPGSENLDDEGGD